MIYIILFVLGMCFGSFGSVISHRLGKFSLIDIWEGKKDFRKAIESILVGRSACTHCKHTLGARDLIPVVSYFVHGGKCRYCKKGIGWVYPLLEVGCGFVFVWVGYFTMQTNMSLLQIILWISASWLLYLLMIYDIKTTFLHETIWAKTAIITAILLGLSKGFLRYFALQWGVVFFLFFLGLYYFARFYVRIRRKKHGEGFGIGDVRLSPIIGCLFGLIQIRHTNSPMFIEGVTQFQRYIIIAGSLGLVYAGVQKALFPDKSIQEIPFFPGMIAALFVIMALA